jgi:predicted O-methyltransferase YrrM
MARVRWLAPDRFRIGAVNFSMSEYAGLELSSGTFLLMKTPAMVKRYIELLSELRPRRIVELGIYEGGSAAFFSLLAKPTRLVALDIQAETPSALEEFIAQNKLGERLRTHVLVDQADADRLRAILAEEFGDEELDLVVDDASHLLSPTRASFEVLFPRLRPGGVFVIEDWSGEHKLDAALASRVESDPDYRATLERRILSGDDPEAPLSVLVFELTLAAAYAPELVAEVGAWDGWAYAVRGPEPVDPDRFALSSTYPESAAALITVRG